MILLSLSLVCLKWQRSFKTNPPQKMHFVSFLACSNDRHSKNMKPSLLVCRIGMCHHLLWSHKWGKKLGEKSKRKVQTFHNQTGKVIWSKNMLIMYTMLGQHEKRRDKIRSFCYFGGMSSYICSPVVRCFAAMRLHDGQLATAGWQFCW